MYVEAASMEHGVQHEVGRQVSGRFDGRVLNSSFCIGHAQLRQKARLEIPLDLDLSPVEPVVTSLISRFHILQSK